MESRVCINFSCGATSSTRWIKGWRLRSGGFANLCEPCGSAYEQSLFCYEFHSKESGWRECTTCSKRLHCGCIASKALLVLTDNGGVQCISCIRKSEFPMTPSDERAEGISLTTNRYIGQMQPKPLDYKSDAGDFGMERLHPGNMDVVEQNGLLQSQRDDTSGSIGLLFKRDNALPPAGELGNKSFSNFSETSFRSTQSVRHNNHREAVAVKDMYESLPQPSLTMSLRVPSASTNLAQPPAGTVVEERDQSKMSGSSQQGQRPRSRTSKTSLGTATESSKDNFPQLRVARPPVEGRGRNQLLPRYWPRITDQELQQISGDSNSTIVPLFEKVLSASDAGRIGRLVLPKACAEAYFPPIHTADGLPLRIQDVKGKEWLFQFRFWPNNNSRMYVLEGVTPCIQSMQLQAGDTVTFSRLDPEGKLVMGFRKASNCVALKDAQLPAVANGPNETFFSGVVENLPTMNCYSGFLQSLKGNMDPHLNVLSERLRSDDGDASLSKTEKNGGRLSEGLSLQPLLVPEKKRSRNIGSKSKRLLIDTEDALELKFTWEEAHDLLRPPPSIKPSIVRIEDYDFEEYEEPPVFGKKTIFTSRSSGEQDQWAQCDSCSKWRRLPVDVILPAKWICSDDACDSKRFTCSVPNELSPMELDNLLKLNMDFKKQKMTGSQQVHEHEPTGLDALASAAVLGDDGIELATSFVATTTRHPRHRPGCTCIVCIQPPSGKGPKHKQTCTCNVCMTVKRRFKTLMLRKKKRQSEKEAEVAHIKQLTWGHKDEAEVESLNVNVPQMTKDSTEASKSHILDLNIQPDREDDQQAISARVTMMSLLHVANRPLETYLRQHGLASLGTEQQASSGSLAPPNPTGEGDKQVNDEGDGDVAPEQVQEGDSGPDEEYYEPEQCQNDPA